MPDLSGLGTLLIVLAVLSAIGVLHIVHDIWWLFHHVSVGII